MLAVLISGTALAGFTIYDSGVPVEYRPPYPGRVIVRLVGNEIEIGVPWEPARRFASLVAIHIDRRDRQFVVLWENIEYGNELGVPSGWPQGIRGDRFWFRVERSALRRGGCYTLHMVRSLHGQRRLIVRVYPFCAP